MEIEEVDLLEQKWHEIIWGKDYVIFGTTLSSVRYSFSRWIFAISTTYKVQMEFKTLYETSLLCFCNSYLI